MAGKGIYGVLELLAGSVLLFAPGATSRLLVAVALELAEGGTAVSEAAARSLAATGSVVASGAAPVAMFLLVHGAVKIMTAWALLRRAVRWYPWALGALALLLAVQIVDVAVAPTAAGALLTVLDLAVILLVTWEYGRLRRDEAAARVAAQAASPADEASEAAQRGPAPRSELLA